MAEIRGPLLFVRETKRMIEQAYKSVTPTSSHFRPGTELPVIRNAFVFQGAGMGEYICYLPAMIWIAKNCPWIHGRIFCAEYFVEFATQFFKDFPDWKILPLEKINQLIEKNSILTGPGIQMGNKHYHQLMNGTGGHLVDVGFMYFASKFPPPPCADIYPEVTFDKTDLPYPLSENKYVVFTTGAVSPARAVPGHYWNPIIDHVVSKHLVPVFLGKTEMAKDFKVKFPSGCDYSKGIDLRDQTSMMTAAEIMKRAACVIGLDNGLLHLAACTDASIVAGYNMVSPSERRPNRRAGKWIELSVSQEELACTQCQTNMKRMFPHNFKDCLYGDTKCIDILFENGGQRWRDALDLITTFDGVVRLAHK